MDPKERKHFIEKVVLEPVKKYTDPSGVTEGYPSEYSSVLAGEGKGMGSFQPSPVHSTFHVLFSRSLSSGEVSLLDWK